MKQLLYTFYDNDHNLIIMIIAQAYSLYITEDSTTGVALASLQVHDILMHHL